MSEIHSVLSDLPINTLINGFEGNRFCFIIPSYQRGYRWTKDQIIQLLTDLYDFGAEKSNGNSLVGEYYCLQPIIVKKLDTSAVKSRLGNDYSLKPNTDYYELVDGQQRLTTLFILLKYLPTDSEPYSIEFERDKGETERSSLINAMKFEFDPDSAKPNCADAHYFIEAFKTIRKWFSDYRMRTGKNNLRSFLATIVCEKTKVIWYELKTDADCYSIFKNINHGKIPLTDAELVKAMLLNSKYYGYANAKASNDSKTEEATKRIVKQEQDRYARLWDEIQKALSHDDMWAFITGGGDLDLPTNIDFLIRLIVLKENPGELGNSDFKFFSYFENQLAVASDKKAYIDGVFESLKNTFRTIQDWYDNYVLHNYIGFILSYSSKKTITIRIQTIIDLIRDYESKSKTAFISELKESIVRIINKKKTDNIDNSVKKDINSLNYQDNRKDVEKLLMLFNIEELNIVHQKFNFSLDENDCWSIEHIKAQHSEITQADKRQEYLENEKESLEKLKESTGDTSLKDKIDEIIPLIEAALLSKPEIDENEFKSVADIIDQRIDGFDSFDMHKLGNLALLSKNDNSSLSNKPFYLKREVINSWLNDPQKNVPKSTMKAFLKMYSTQDYSLDFTRWRKNDFEKMFNRQKELLKDFIGGC